MLTKDALNKAAWEKERSNVTESRQLLAMLEQTSDTVKSNNTDEYVMLALDGKDQVPCVSCGYPTLRMFGPERHLRFGRKECCSSGCYITHAHYKEEGEDLLREQTVKRVTDALRAATSVAIKTLRKTNAEEVAGGKCAHDSTKAAETNREDISRTFSLLVTYAWNATNGMAVMLNKRLTKAKLFSNLVPDVAVMGQTEPHLFGKKKAAGTGQSGQPLS